MKIALFGFTGFLGANLQAQLSNVLPVNIREKNWKNDVQYDASIFINCIGKAHDHKGKATYEEFYTANVEIVKDIYSEFLKSDAELLIHISSIAAVEENERIDILTEESVCRPQSFYGRSKQAAEKFLLEQNLPLGKKIVILRPTMIHGEGDKGNLILLYKIVSSGIPYPLGAFHNSRSFIGVDNLIFVINEIIHQKKSVSSGIYNICDDQPLSTRRIIDIISEITKKKYTIWALPKKSITVLAIIGDKMSLPINSKRLGKMTSNLLVSNKKIKNELGIAKLPFSAEDGMRKTIASFNK